MITIVFRDFVNKFELPSDVMLGDTILEIIGKNTLYIENYIRIVIFNEEQIVIQCKCYRLKVCGKNLQIAYYNEVELKIMGVINGISFC